MPGGQRLAGPAKLRPGRHEGGPRAPRAHDRRGAGCGERADLSRPEPYSGVGDHVSGANVAAAWAEVRTHCDRLENLHFVVMIDNILDGDDGIGAVRDDGAGGDRRRLPGPQFTSRRPPGRDPLDDREDRGRVDRAEREAVHRRAREGRQVDRGDRALRQHASGGLLERHALARERLCAGEDALERLVDR